MTQASTWGWEPAPPAGREVGVWEVPAPLKHVGERGRAGLALTVPRLSLCGLSVCVDVQWRDA